MSGVVEYRVTEPPTSDGVNERVLASLSAPTAATRGILDLVIIACTEVPKSDPQSLKIQIARSTLDGGINSVVEGYVRELDGIATDPDIQPTVIVRLQDNLAEAALATVVHG